MERFRGGFVSTSGGGSGWEGLHRNSKRLVPKSFPKRPTSVYVSVLRWKTWLYSWRMSGSYSNQPTELPKDCIVSSGVFQATGLSWENINQGEWSRLANLLVQKLGLDPHHPDTTIRIHQLYMPIFFWLLKFCDQKKKAPIIGISCPQGGGKTTLTFALQYLFQQLRYQCAVASIDDFYITRKEQEELFHKEKNPLLEFRGNPGTHDIELGVQVLSQLQGCKSNNERVAIPRYNKAAWNGLGDRFPVEQWQWVDCPVDIILLEGW